MNGSQLSYALGPFGLLLEKKFICTECIIFGLRAIMGMGWALTRYVSEISIESVKGTD